MAGPGGPVRARSFSRRIFLESCRAGCSLFGTVALDFTLGESGGSLGDLFVPRTWSVRYHVGDVVTSDTMRTAYALAALLCVGFAQSSHLLSTVSLTTVRSFVNEYRVSRERTSDRFRLPLGRWIGQLQLGRGDLVVCCAESTIARFIDLSRAVSS